MQKQEIPVELNKEYVAEIVGIGHHGEGVGRVNGFTLFVPGALPGEKARVLVTQVKKQYGAAELLEIVEGSPERVHPPCAVFAECGGCQLQHLSYEAQLQIKRQMVVDSLERIGKLKVAPLRFPSAGGHAGDRAVVGDRAVGGDEAVGPDKDAAVDEAVDGAGAVVGDSAVEGDSGLSGDGTVGVDGDMGRENGMLHRENEVPHTEREGIVDGIVVHPTLGMAEPWRYRNKAQVPIGLDEGGLVGGFYAAGTHRIVDTDACLIQHERNDEAIRKVKEIGRRLGIPPYDEMKHTGLLRHVLVRTAIRTGEVMVVLVTNGRNLPKRERWIEEIRREIPGVKSICQNINTRRTNLILGEETVVLWGRDVIYDQIGDIRFAISSRSFYQVNPVQTEVLYEKALEYAGLTGEETVIDAYCGIGTISLFLARKAKRVYGVEIVREAVEDARRNAALNGITNAEFAAGRAEEVLPRWKKQGIAADVIVVDPPRKGCDSSLLETMLAMKPKRIVYVSCNPATLARDLRILEDGGYRTLEVQPVDMFPQTSHVECCVSLVRK